MNHRILQRPRDLTVAVECSATQGHAKQRSYIFVYTCNASHSRRRSDMLARIADESYATLSCAMRSDN